MLDFTVFAFWCQASVIHYVHWQKYSNFSIIVYSLQDKPDQRKKLIKDRDFLGGGDQFHDYHFFTWWILMCFGEGYGYDAL